MLKALVGAGIEADFVVGTSIGAINGALFASSPNAEGVRIDGGGVERARVQRPVSRRSVGRARSAIGQRTYVHANDHLRSWLTSRLGGSDIESLPAHFECVAACIEDSSEHWFTSGPVVDALLASSAVPGLLPPVEVGGKHYIDGGVVNSIPLSRAFGLGATTVFVLHVGHIDDELEVPTNPWDVGVVAFEIARRHRFTTDLASIPDGVAVHVLPTGAKAGRFNDPAKLRYATSRTRSRASHQLSARPRPSREHRWRVTRLS